MFIDTPGGEIKVTVVALYQNGVRIGISAPHEYNIYREELINQLKQASSSALGNTEQPTQILVQYKSSTLERLASRLIGKTLMERQRDAEIRSGASENINDTHSRLEPEQSCHSEDVPENATKLRKKKPRKELSQQKND